MNNFEEDIKSKLFNLNVKSNLKKNIFLILGLAGSGKTTFFKRLSSWLIPNNNIILKSNGLPSTQFTINLDTASILELTCDYDIRDHINYEETLNSHQLGPNGGILTCLNIQSLNFHEVLDNIPNTVNNILIDTPGQIEAFSWSSSGQIIIDLLKTMESKGFKLNILYLIDSLESNEPNTFMTNMVTSCTIKYRFQCDFISLFSKIDLNSLNSKRIREWISDYDNFQRDLTNYNESYENEILSSLALHFEDMYKEMKILEVSGISGAGKEEFLNYFGINLLSQ